MKINPIVLNNANNAFFADSNRNKNGIYVSPVENSKQNSLTIQRALDELSAVTFLPQDLKYMQNLGVNPPFLNGSDAVNFIKSNNISIQYAKFSNPKVHACLDENARETSILINANYAGMKKKSDICAISEAIFHEAGHAKDFDIDNSIQEELDCIGLNVLAHRAYEKKYPKIFESSNSFLYKEGVNLYSSLFYSQDSNKTELLNRMYLKYGYLEVSSKNHDAGELAKKVKHLNLSA